MFAPPSARVAGPALLNLPKSTYDFLDKIEKEGLDREPNSSNEHVVV
jgi:hypothetical protein